MLPGFRFLFAATFMTMSILVFGLGAAALLRAAHEQFATNPAWHAAPEATFAQQVESTRPVLALLRVAGPAAEQKSSGNAAGADVSIIPAPTERAMAVPAPAEPAAIAALKPEPPASPTAARSDTPVAESPASGGAAAAPGDSPASETTKVATSSGETVIATTDPAIATPASPPPDQAVPPAAGVEAPASPASAAASPEADGASTKTAAIETPSVTVEAKPPSTMIGPKPDPSLAKRQLRARRAAHRRRMAARAARLAQLAAQQLLQQQAADPFGLRFGQPAAAAVAVAVAQDRTHFLRNTR